MIAQVKEQRDLGIIVTCNLSWSAHITSTCGKAYQILSMIRRSVPVTSPSYVKEAFILIACSFQTDILLTTLATSTDEKISLFEKFQRRAISVSLMTSVIITKPDLQN